ncbi:hypothetical protein ACO0LM_26715 [Undibacterium sp. Di26W]|uniref:hypothetical protein n=1 Tax=Undibacterium sp. Di26W TaxID=3413035 RepID=UPI003BF3CDFD
MLELFAPILMCFFMPLLLPLGRWLTGFCWLALMSIFINAIMTLQAMLQMELNGGVADDGMTFLFLLACLFFLCLSLIIRLIAVQLLTWRGYHGYGDLHGFKSWWKGNQPLALHWFLKLLLLLPLVILTGFGVYSGPGSGGTIGNDPFMAGNAIAPAIYGTLLGMICCDAPFAWSILVVLPGIAYQLKYSWNVQGYLSARSWPDTFNYLIVYATPFVFAAYLSGLFRRTRVCQNAD